MRLSAWARSPGQLTYDGEELLRLSLIVSIPVTGVWQLLRTAPSQLMADPVLQAEHWLTTSLITLPLFAAGVWAGDWVASRAGLGLARRADICKRALIMSLLVAVAFIPLWYVRNKTDTQLHAQALTTPHSHGGIDVYWVAPGVIVALVCACLIPLALWGGFVIGGRLAGPLARRPAVFVRAAVLMVAVAAVPPLAWLLQHAAQNAYASQVEYTRALLLVRVHSHAFFGVRHGSRALAGPRPTQAPFAFAYQFAHAFQDGLAGQAAGFPVAAAVLLWSARGTAYRGRHHQAVACLKEERNE